MTTINNSIMDNNTIKFLSKMEKVPAVWAFIKANPGISYELGEIKKFIYFRKGNHEFYVFINGEDSFAVRLVNGEVPPTGHILNKNQVKGMMALSLHNWDEVQLA